MGCHFLLHIISVLFFKLKATSHFNMTVNLVAACIFLLDFISVIFVSKLVTFNILAVYTSLDMLLHCQLTIQKKNPTYISLHCNF